MRLLVIGENGQVARSLHRIAHLAGIPILCVGRAQYDLVSSNSWPPFVAAFRPTVIVNAAAYTAVDQAEAESSLAFSVNSAGAQKIARLAQQLDCPLLHLSTDYVFDGTKPRAYRESDGTSPLGVYGRSKREGERHVLRNHNQAFILRTSWVYSPFGKNFLNTMLGLAHHRNTLNVVDDQFGCPTNALHLAQQIIHIAHVLEDRPVTCDQRTFHLAAEGAASWSTFAAAIFDISQQLGGPSAAVMPIPTSAFPTLAARPKNSVLDSSAAKRVFGAAIPHWRIGILPVLKELLALPINQPGELRTIKDSKEANQKAHG